MMTCCLLHSVFCQCIERLRGVVSATFFHYRIQRTDSNRGDDRAKGRRLGMYALKKGSWVEK